MRFRLILICASCCVLISCSDEQSYAPVFEVNHIEPIPEMGIHRVIQGETLYEVAWRYGLDYRFLAKTNQINPPYAIRSGQVILLREHQQKIVMKPVNHSLPTVPQKKSSHEPLAKRKNFIDEKSMETNIHTEPSYFIAHWQRPAQGNIINTFSGLNKGINIAGQLGEPIYAAAPGKVVYAGNGLRGYGNLIILKHNNLYLSAYAYNRRLLVHEGEWVKGGQKIAEMGNTVTDKTILHFEIRRAGKPIDPMPLF